MTIDNVLEHDLEDIASAIASQSFNGMFIGLYGDLGAGKTTFVKAFAASLGINEISSPTFTIVCEHERAGASSLLHFDAYRLQDEDELYAIGFDDYLNKNGIVLMEWADKVTNALPKSRIDIYIDGSGFNPRNVRIIAYGRYYEHLLEVL